MIEQKPGGDGVVEVTFRLPATEPPGDVSVVGDFNDWQPGVHRFRLEPDGTRMVSVTVPAGPHYFRYLASGGVWRDDDQADAVTADGSVIYCHAAPQLPQTPAESATPPAGTAAPTRRSSRGGSSASGAGQRRPARTRTTTTRRAMDT